MYNIKQGLLFSHYYLVFIFIWFFSHFSLLLGCALPIWMSSGFNDRPLTPFAGILSLGIGDTMVRILFNIYFRLSVMRFLFRA